jgi:drug/metabolite transporter (DMT)-like permease
MLTALFVATRILANPVSNVLQKQLTQRSCDPGVIIAATHVLLAITVLPLLAAPVSLTLPGAFWIPMAACALLAVASNTLIVAALRSSDLSVLGPINAWKSVVSLVAAAFILGEWPTLAGSAGMLLIVAGSFFIADPAADQGKVHAFSQLLRNRGVQLRLVALVLSAIEAVFLKRALHHTPALTAFVAWSFLCLPIAIAATAVFLRGQLRPQTAKLGPNLRTLAALTLTTGLMQLTSLLTFERLLVGYSLALFQLSSLLSVLLGHHFFQEQHLRRRLLGAGIMSAGAALIIVFPNTAR